MRALFVAVLFLLPGCTRNPGPNVPQSTEIVFDDTGPFIRVGNRKHLDHVSEPPSDAVLIVSWVTVSDFINQGRTTPTPDRLSLIFGASGYVTLLRETAMRTVLDWTRYYPESEAENLFDSIIPAIEQFDLGDLRAPPDGYVCALPIRRPTVHIATTVFFTTSRQSRLCL